MIRRRAKSIGNVAFYTRIVPSLGFAGWP